jgi:hypothetical protein
MPDPSKINKYSEAEARDNRRAAGLPLGGGLDATATMGHVPEENVARYTRLRELSHLLSRMGNMVSGLNQHEDANTLWALGGKYKRMANELRAPLPAPPKEEEP